MSELLYIRIILRNSRLLDIFWFCFFPKYFCTQEKKNKKNDVYILLCFAYLINSTMDLRFFKLHRFLITMQMY